MFLHYRDTNDYNVWVGNIVDEQRSEDDTYYGYMDLDMANSLFMDMIKNDIIDLSQYGLGFIGIHRKNTSSLRTVQNDYDDDDEVIPLVVKVV